MRVPAPELPLLHRFPSRPDRRRRNEAHEETLDHFEHCEPEGVVSGDLHYLLSSWSITREEP